MALRVARVHAVEIGRKQRGLIATGSGADLDDRRPVRQRILRSQVAAQLRLQPLRLPAQLLHLRFGKGRQLRVAAGRSQLPRFRELLAHTLQPARRLGRRFQLRPLTRHRTQPLRVRQHRRVRELLRQRVVTPQHIRDPVLPTHSRLFRYRKSRVQPRLSALTPPSSPARPFPTSAGTARPVRPCPPASASL